MPGSAAKRLPLRERIAAYRDSDAPIRKLAGNLSKVAKTALDEANKLTIEHVPIYLNRLPKNLDGFRIIQLSDTHHSPFTSLKHIERAVRFANRLKPNLCVLTGDYVTHSPEYIGPVAAVLAKLRAKYGIYAC